MLLLSLHFNKKWSFIVVLLISALSVTLSASDTLLNSEQKIGKKRQFYSHLCRLQSYMLDPVYTKIIKKKYASVVIFKKDLFKKYNKKITKDYTIQSLLNRSLLLSPFSISSSVKSFKKKLEKYNINKLYSQTYVFSKFVDKIPQNKKLEACVNKNYPKLNLRHLITTKGDKKKLLAQLYKTSLLYKSWIEKNNITKSILKNKDTVNKINKSLKKIYQNIIDQPIHSLLINFKSKWSIKTGHYLNPQLSKLAKALLATKSNFNKDIKILLKNSLHSSIKNIKKLTQNICQKKITNLYHDIVSVEKSILEHNSNPYFYQSTVTEDLAAYCYLIEKDPKKEVGLTWKSYTGLGLIGASFVARMLSWINKKSFFVSNFISTLLFAKETYDNWLTNLEHSNIYNINKYRNKMQYIDLKKIKKDKDIIVLDASLLTLPALVSKISQFSRYRKLKKINKQFTSNFSKTTSHMLTKYANSPSKWWPYYKILRKKLDIKLFKQFFWAKHELLKKAQLSYGHKIGVRANNFFARINQNYITPAHYLKDKDFVQALVSLEKIISKNTLKYITQLIKKSSLYKKNINSVIEKALEAEARLKKLSTIKIKVSYFSKNKTLTIKDWPTINKGILNNEQSITFNSYNNYKAFLLKIKKQSNYLPKKSIDDLLQNQRLYTEQIKQASNIRQLQIIQNKLRLINKIKTLNLEQKKIFDKLSLILKNSDIFPPKRAFKKIFLKELYSEIKYLKQGAKKRQKMLSNFYPKLAEEKINALSKSSSFFSNNIKTIFWTGSGIIITSAVTANIQIFGLDYIFAQLESKMRSIVRFFSRDGYTAEEKICALESINFKKFMICYNALIKKEMKIEILRMRNFEFSQRKNELKNKYTENNIDIHDYKIKLYSSIKKKMKRYNYRLLKLRSQFSIQEFFYNLKEQTQSNIKQQFISAVLKEIKENLNAESFIAAKAILTLNTNKEQTLKAIANLKSTLTEKQNAVFLLQSILYQIHSKKEQYNLYFKNTGQLPIELIALIKNKELIELKELSIYQEFNLLSGNLLEEVDFFKNPVF